MLDLLVIGAGLSGLTAALIAARAGKTVRVVAKGMGATHWHAGTIDWLGYMPGSGAPVHNPLSQTKTLAETHPYSRLGTGAVSTALSSLRKNLADSGLNYGAAVSSDANLWLPSAVGAARPTYLAPVAQMAGDLANTAPILVVGFHGMRDFYPQLIAENLNRQGYTSRAAFLPLDTITSRIDANSVQLAYALDHRERQQALAASLRKLARQGERVGLPAILAIDTHEGFLDTLQQTVGVPIFEIPTLPPSVPGIRLHQSLVRQLQALGARVEIGMTATTFSAQGKQILWVETETSSRPLKHRADNFLLTTGGVLGGGFSSDATGRFWEVLFHLPLTVPQRRADWFRPEFLDRRGQPVFLGGVSVDDSFQPTDADGQVLYTNLWAAGGLLAHTDPIQERSLEGIAVATATGAAQAILKDRS